MQKALPAEQLPADGLLRALTATRAALDAQRNRSLLDRLSARTDNVLTNIFGRVAPAPNEDDALAAPAPYSPYAKLRPEAGAARLRRDTQNIDVMPGQIAAAREGDFVVTRDSTVNLSFFEGQRAELRPGTRAQLTSLAQRMNDRLVEVAVSIGQAMADVSKPLQGGDSFAIATPAATASVRGTAFEVAVDDSGQSTFETLHGTVAVRMGEQEVLLAQGFKLTATPGAPLPEPVLAVAPAPVPEPPPAPVPEPRKLPQFERVFVTREGDTIFTLAAKFGIRVSELIRANPVLQGSVQIAAGTLIVVPPRNI